MDSHRIEELRHEAARLRKDYYYTRKALKQKPADQELRKWAEQIQARYAEIQGLMARAQQAPGAGAHGPAVPAPPPVDMSRFEPKPYAVPPAVVVGKQRRSVSDLVRGFSSPAKLIKWTIYGPILLVAAVFFFLMIFKGMSFYVVPSESMSPTLEPGDRFVAIASPPYRRGDILVMEDPNDPAAFLVKRCVGLPGDVVEVRNGALFVNNRFVDEPYLSERMEYRMEPVTLGPDEVFLLGDNRNESDDGHLWEQGFPLRKITGRVFYIYYPSARRGRIPSQNGAFANVPEGERADE